MIQLLYIWWIVRALCTVVYLTIEVGHQTQTEKARAMPLMPLSFRASPAGRRISASENVRARPFPSTEMVEINRAYVYVGGGSSGTTHFLFESFFITWKYNLHSLKHENKP
jgi:hypothetical protein